MRTVEIWLNHVEAAQVMQEMRLWLDAHGMAPSRSTSTETAGHMVVRTEFDLDAEAEAFAARFAGRLRSN